MSIATQDHCKSLCKCGGIFEQNPGGGFGEGVKPPPAYKGGGDKGKGERGIWEAWELGRGGMGEQVGNGGRGMVGLGEARGREKAWTSEEFTCNGPAPKPHPVGEDCRAATQTQL